MFYFVTNIRKTCYRKKLKTEPLKPIYILTEETTSWFLWIKLLKMTCTRSYAWFLNFWDCFLWHVLPKHSKITVNCPKSVEEKNRVSFDLPKVSRMNINFKLLKISRMTSLKICIFPVTEKLETSNLDSR